MSATTERATFFGVLEVGGVSRYARLSVILVCVAGGCTVSDGVAPEPVARHKRTLVEVDTREPPSLIVFRSEGSTTWQVPTSTSESTFELEVDGPYRVTVVCDEVENGFVSVRQVARTLADDHAIELACDTQTSQYRVTGTMVQAGELCLGTERTRTRLPGAPFALPADRGVHALVAFDDDHIAVRRPIPVTRDTVLRAPIDLAAEGGAFVPVTLTPTNLDGTETVMTGVVSLRAGDTLALLYAGDLAATKVAPDAVLSPRDSQEVTVAVHSPTVGRTVTRNFRAGDPTTFALPEAIGPLEFDELAVTWSTLPDYDTFELSFDAFSFETFVLTFHQVVLSRSFIEATGITGASLETETLTGFRPEWDIDPTQEYHRFAGVLDELANGDVVGSDASELVNAPASLTTTTASR